MLTNYFAAIARLLRKQPRARTIVKPRKSVRLNVEALEDRCVPSVNHAPVGVSNTVTTLENTAKVFQLSDFGFTDPDDSPANNFQAVVIDSLPVFGTFTNNGQNISTNQAVSASDINAGYVRFTPESNASGSSLTGFYFRVQDDGGTAGDPNDPMSFGHDTDATSRYMNINVTWVNQTPSFSAFDPPAIDMCVDTVSISNWATFNPGGGWAEASQTATYLVANVSNPDMFAQMPSVSQQGTLTYRLNPFANGASTFDVKVVDNGGTENGAQDTSSVSTFTLVVNPHLTFTVNTTADTEDVNVTDDQPCDGRALDVNGLTSLRAAIEEANAAGAETSVAINFNLQPNATLGMTAALPPIYRTVGINGLGTNHLTISRTGAERFRILTVERTGNVTVSNVSMTNGYPAAATYGGMVGGAVWNAGTLDLYMVTLTSNRTDSVGGAIYNVPQAVLTVRDCTIGTAQSPNQAQNMAGGIYNGGQATISDNTEIAWNTARSAGGIYNHGAAQLTITDGALIFSNYATGDGLLSGRGGGVENYGVLSMSNCYLWGNESVQQGGGLYNGGDGSATLNNVDISGNEATSANTGKGAGIYVGNGIVSLTGGCTVSGNSAAALGNGICLGNGAMGESGVNDIADGIVADPNP